MCEAEGELKNTNSNVQDKKENKVKTEKENKHNNLNVSNYNVVPPVSDIVDEHGVDWDQIPF